jgi:CspA family cold shock protein
MNTGTVRFYNLDKGFGFIRQDNSDSSEYFFHFSGLKNAVSANQDDKVTFDVIPDRNRPGSYRATNITILPDEE